MKSNLLAEFEDTLIVPAIQIFNDIPTFKFDGNNLDHVDLGSFHIYLICRRNRLRFEPLLNVLNILNTGFICGYITEKTDDNLPPTKHFYTLDLSKQLNMFRAVDKNISVTVSNDRTTINIKNSYSELSIPLNSASPGITVPNTQILDLEILYIGQSKKKSDSYDTKTRLQLHTPLANIQTDTNNSYPHKEVVLVFIKVRFNPSGGLMIDGQSDYSIEKMKKLHEGLARSAKQENIIDLTEMTLIQYFQTDKYNDDYIKPLGKNLKAIQILKANDVGKFSMKIETEYFRTSLYSEKRAKNSGHLLVLDINSLQISNQFFDNQ